MPAHFSYFRTIGEIIEEDLKEPGIALGLKESQISQCVAHSTNSLLWGMDYLENNIDKHPNYRIKVKQHQFDTIFLFVQRRLSIYDNLEIAKRLIKVFNLVKHAKICHENTKRSSQTFFSGSTTV